MTQVRWALTVATVLGAAVGCAGTHPQVDDARVARLPASERANLVAYEQRVTVAESNLARAEAALVDARRFVVLADAEVNAQSKRRYAGELLELREAQFEAAQAMATATRADLEYAKLRAVERNAMQAGLDRKRFVSAHLDTQAALDDKRQEVAQQRGPTERARDEWLAQRQLPAPAVEKQPVSGEQQKTSCPTPSHVHP